MTISKIRDLISGATLVQDDIIYKILGADDDFRYDVAIAFILKENGILIINGFCNKLKVPSDRVSDAIIYCNEHNRKSAFTQAYYHTDHRDFNVTWAMDTENSTDECIRHHIKLLTSAMWHFFVDVGKEF